MMRKYLIGTLIGFLLAIPLTAFADEITSLIGEKVQAENVVVVNREELPIKAVNINGTTYSPNRAIADALGMDIKFEEQKVIFETKQSTSNNELSEKGGSNLDKSAQLESINRAIESRYDDITRIEYMLQISVPNEGITRDLNEAIDKASQEITELEAERDELQGQLEAEQAALEAEQPAE